MLPTQAFRLAIQPAKEQEDVSGWSLQVICSGRLNSFQLKSVREVLRDWYHIDGIYWPNTLHLDTGKAPVCKRQDGKSWSRWLTSAFVKVDLSYQNLCPKGGDVNPNWSTQARVGLLPQHWPVYTTQLNGSTGIELWETALHFVWPLLYRPQNESQAFKPKWMSDPHVNEVWAGRQKKGSTFFFLFLCTEKDPF